MSPSAQDNMKGIKAQLREILPGVRVFLECAIKIAPGEYSPISR